MSSNLGHIDWRNGVSRRGPVLGLLGEDHPSAITHCLLCKTVLGTEQATQWLIIGPVTDAEWDKHAAGVWYPAPAQLVHDDCLEVFSDDLLEDVIAQLVAYVGSAP